MPRLIITVLALLLGQAVFAQDSDPAAESAEPASPLDQELARIDEQQLAYEALARQLEGLEGDLAKITAARVDAMWTSLSTEKLAFAEKLVEAQASGADISAHRDAISGRLEHFSATAHQTIDRLRDNIVFPRGEQSPTEYVILDQQLRRSVERFDQVYVLLMRYAEVAIPLELTAPDFEAGLGEELRNSAANRSVFLQLALDQVSVMREASRALPEDEEIKARLAAAEARVRVASMLLQDIVAVMDEFDLPTQYYHQQLLKVTGELTTQVLDVGVIAGLLSQWGSSVKEFFATEGPRLLFRLLLVLFIIYVFIRIGRSSRTLVAKALNSSRLRVSTLLRDMIVSSVKNLIILVGLLIAMSQLGLSLGPLLAGLGIAGFIIGFALQDTLSNFASGMMILFYRPFDVGDYVDAGGVAGTVSHMSLVNTTFKTIDNQLLIVPNNLVWAGVITNVTAQTTRRVDLVFGVSYTDDLKKVESILRDIVDSNDAVLDDPEPVVCVHELADSSVNFIVRPWVKTDDYWPTYWAITRAVKDRFDEEGVTIPFPQQEVHLAKT